MKRIMVVDDEDDVREMISIMMQNEGFVTEKAEDGSEFLNKIDVFQPDLVTLDVMMPGLTTPEILEKLKKKKNTTKIILVTIVRFSNAERGMIFSMANIVDYIRKPFEFDYFIDIVKKHAP